MTIDFAIKKYLDSVRFVRSEHTSRAYKNALNVFRSVLLEQSLDPNTTSIEKLTEALAVPFVIHLNKFALATEKLYIQAIKSFYEYVNADGLAEINVSRLRNLIHQCSRHSHTRIPKLSTNKIELLLKYISDIQNLQVVDGVNGKLRAMRDRAFLLTLADTGLRVHEACELQCDSLNWEGGTLSFGKVGKQAVVRLSTRSMRAIQDYLSLRDSVDSNSGHPSYSMPLFARHDKGAGKKIKPITPTTGRNIVAERVEMVLGKEAIGTITPHSFRHYFVTIVLKGSGNLKLAQELARHRNIQVTQSYASLSDDELDRGYYDIFEKKIDGK